MNNPVEFFIDDATPAVRFESNDTAFGETREIWFSHNGYVFQVLLYSEDPRRLDALVRQIGTDVRFVDPSAPRK